MAYQQPKLNRTLEEIDRALDDLALLARDARDIATKALEKIMNMERGSGYGRNDRKPFPPTVTQLNVIINENKFKRDALLRKKNAQDGSFSHSDQETLNAVRTRIKKLIETLANYEV